MVLVGNVGQTPECKEVGDKKVANFSLATSESYKNKDGTGGCGGWFSLTFYVHGLLSRFPSHWLSLWLSRLSKYAQVKCKS